uniref:HAT C-terminal dimerisation domain-containing protein n=1 Tax=Lates calcarifer TaxID=8187 RepID=A0A4W6FI89_LATCA
MNISSKKSTAVAENATATSYEVAKLIAQHGKPFSDGDFIKQCLIKVDLSAKKEKYVSVIASLVTEFNQRVIEKQIKLFSTPFLVDAEEVEESLQLELIEMQCDDSLQSQHQLLSLPDFYQSLDNAKFPLMRRHAKRMMSLFGSTYICEQTFSLLNQNKSRLRTRMTDSHLCEVLRVSTTKLSPDMSAILQSRGQHHCSH